MAGHHIGIALNNDRLLALGNILAGQVDAVEHLALLI